MAGEWTEDLAQKSSIHLPPLDKRNFDLQTSKRIDTPIDEVTGLVDRERLITEILKTADPNYDWKSPFADLHHLQWPNRWYDTSKDTGMSIEGQKFRNLASNKVKEPRVFHNWLHLVTQPPEPPRNEVMHIVIEVDKSMTSLRGLVGYSRFLARKARNNGKDYTTTFRQNLIRRMDSFGQELERVQRAPIEFRPEEVEGAELHNIYDMVHISERLGRYASSAMVRLDQNTGRQEERAA